jgi:hypothetical protein
MTHDLATTSVVLGYIGLLTFVLWFLVTRPGLPLKEKISSLLQLLAVYTFILGLLSASGVFSAFGSMQRDLISADPLLFLRGNFAIFTVLFGAAAVALDPNTQSWVSILVTLVLSLFLFFYAVIHFFVIVPLGYFAYLISSVPVDAVLNAHSEVQITIGSESVSIKSMVLKNETAIRNFAVGIPASMVSLLLKIWSLLRSEQPHTGG